MTVTVAAAPAMTFCFDPLMSHPLSGVLVRGSVRINGGEGGNLKGLLRPGNPQARLTQMNPS
jgi:hypothetical protein